MFPASRISVRAAQLLMTGSSAMFVFGSQKLVGSQPPLACTNTYSLPAWCAASANGRRKPMDSAPVVPSRPFNRFLRFMAEASS